MSFLRRFGILLALAYQSLCTPVFALENGYSGTEDERAAKQALDESKYIRARELAQKILDKGPSIIATFVLSEVHAEFEGNLARALFLIRKARDDFYTAFGPNPNDVEQRLWLRQILQTEANILGAMDSREEQLVVLKQLFDFTQSNQHRVTQIWPLVKLRRFEEARTLGKELISDPDYLVRLTAYNSLMAVEDEARKRRAGYDWGIAGRQLTQGQSCVISMNLALACLQNYKIADAIQYDLEAIKAPDFDCSTHPYAQISGTYLLQGEFQQSISSLLSLRKIPRIGIQRVQSEMTIRGRLVETLYALNQIPAALDRSRQIAANTDRTGSTSASTENYRLRDLVIHWLILSAQIERSSERLSARPLSDRLPLYKEQLALKLERSETAHLTLPYITYATLMTDIARAYYTDIKPWYMGQMAELLGYHIFEQIIEEARALETDEIETGNAYYDAYLGELRWRQGKDEEALSLAEKALAALPQQERLFRARIEAWKADTLWRQGQLEAAIPLYSHVFEQFPTAFRILGLRVPIQIETDGGPTGELIAERLQDSPRIYPTDGAFKLQIDAQSERISLCLFYPSGRRLSCVETKLSDLEEENLSEEAFLAHAIDRFHDHAFAPLVDLTQSDLHSLDGRPVQVDAATAIEDLLGEKKEKKH